MPSRFLPQICLVICLSARRQQVNQFFTKKSFSPRTDRWVAVGVTGAICYMGLRQRGDVCVCVCASHRFLRTVNKDLLKRLCVSVCVCVCVFVCVCVCASVSSSARSAIDPPLSSSHCPSVRQSRSVLVLSALGARGDTGAGGAIR